MCPAVTGSGRVMSGYRSKIMSRAQLLTRVGWVGSGLVGFRIFSYNFQVESGWVGLFFELRWKFRNAPNPSYGTVGSGFFGWVGSSSPWSDIMYGRWGVVDGEWWRYDSVRDGDRRFSPDPPRAATHNCLRSRSSSSRIWGALLAPAAVTVDEERKTVRGCQRARRRWCW
jgi:hypothetical protein